MFLLSDSQSDRHTRIRTFKGQEASIGALLATIDFEWTVRRAVLACGTSPNSTIRNEVLQRCSGIDAYRDAWKSEVVPRFGKPLPTVVTNWSYIKTQAFPFRHRVVHGVRGASGAKYSNDRRDALLRASVDVVEFASTQNIELYGRLPVRRKKAVQ
ncbi:MAG: hypothetical protein HND58_12985 [Planctomycetota bacterium]|nr:MAG: hypothetical protein HND58_12985 [Planctomycetota bacterium]